MGLNEIVSVFDVFPMCNITVILLFMQGCKLPMSGHNVTMISSGMSLIKLALEIAAKAHKNQVRKGTGSLHHPLTMIPHLRLIFPLADRPADLISAFFLLHELLKNQGRTLTADGTDRVPVMPIYLRWELFLQRGQCPAS